MSNMLFEICNLFWDLQIPLAIFRLIFQDELLLKFSNKSSKQAHLLFQRISEPLEYPSFKMLLESQEQKYLIFSVKNRTKIFKKNEKSNLPTATSKFIWHPKKTTSRVLEQFVCKFTIPRILIWLMNLAIHPKLPRSIFQNMTFASSSSVVEAVPIKESGCVNLLSL